MPPDVSVIIVNLNTKTLLRVCLESVFRTAGALSLEVIVVDNGSTDGSADMVQSEFASVKLHRNATNEGFARPNNLGLRMSEGRYVLLLNSDTVVGEGAFESLVRFMQGHPNVGACGPMLVYPDGRTQHSAKGFPTPFTHFCDMLYLDRLFPNSRLFGKGEMRYFDYTRAGQVDHLMAAAFLVRRKVLEDVGLLDERFAIYYNDMDWCYRMHAAGWTIWYVPEARVVHHLGSTVGKVNRRFALFGVLHENVLLFYQKHHGRAAVVLYRLCTIAGFILRSIGWTVVAPFRASEFSRHMMVFSWKTLWWALPFWRPARDAGIPSQESPSQEMPGQEGPSQEIPGQESPSQEMPGQKIPG